jgi:hypothetical protein
MSVARAFPLARLRLARHALALLTLTALADFLFFGQNLGACVSVLVLCTGAAAALVRPLPPRAVWLLLLAAAPCLADAGILSCTLAAFGTAYAITARWQAAVAVLRGAFWRLPPDAWRGARAVEGALRAGRNPMALLVWVVPLGFGVMFLSLFATANPVIENGLAWANPLNLFTWVSPGRVMFWLAAAGFIWPVLAPAREFAPWRWGWLPMPPAEAAALLFGKAAILRALALFNLIFAVQTALDVYYLWFGRRLPDGLSYADYAHRGAYPLIATALLAGAFAILATKPGSEAGRSHMVRGLVLIWVGQNLLLVGSALLRLDIYVQAYALTELRLAACIWMLHVAVGLVLILARIALGRSNAWLVRCNAGLLAVTLYGCAFVNVPAVIAGYDVRHSAEYAGAGPKLDLNYLQSLGPQVIPALDLLERRIAGNAASNGCIFSQSGPAGQARNALAAAFIYDAGDWRGWSFWDWYLAVYLQAHGVRCG